MENGDLIMKTRKSIALGFSSAVALGIALAGFVATASGQSTSLSGTVQGGLSPISGARVSLFAAGRGYGSGAERLGGTTSDSNGNFTVEYTPPATPAVLYLLAHKGNAGSGTNWAIGLMGVAGMSDALPASVTINELTTVAAEWALAQFIGSTGRNVGAPASNATGFLNAVNQLESNLVDIASGAPAVFWTNNGVTEASCTGASPPVNCDGLMRLDTIANILAACVESSPLSSHACSKLLGTTGSSNTLQAAHVMATNPEAHITALFALQNGSPPFTPALTAVPDGWEVALSFAPSGANFAYPYGVAIDAAGNVWVPNPFSQSVTELTSKGTLVGNFNNTNTSGANFEGYQQALAIDAAGNVWVTNNTFDFNSSVTELTSSGTLVGNFNNTNTSGDNFDGTFGVAIDAAGNVWLTNGYGNNSVTEFTPSSGLAGNFAPSGADFDVPYMLSIDATGNVWVANNYGNSVTELTSSGGLAGNFNNINTSGANIDGPQGVAIDADGNVWMDNYGNSGGSSVTELTSSGGLIGNFNNTNTSGANFSNAGLMAIDAASNVWVPNTTGNSLTELTSSGGLAGYFAPSGANFDNPWAVAIDAAGNVWVVNRLSNSVAELVGAARPVLTPLVACLKRTPPSTVCLP